MKLKPANKHILNVLGWTPEAYYMHVFESGIAYLSRWTKSVQYANQISSTKTFWKWWTEQYELRNQSLVVEFGLDLEVNWTKITKKVLLEAYYETHDAKLIKAWPSKVVQKLIRSEQDGRLTILKNE